MGEVDISHVKIKFNVLHTYASSDMPYKESDQLISPQDTEISIWRYMNLAKFLSLIDKSALYFSSIEQLTTQDRFEGYYTNANVQLCDINSPILLSARLKYRLEKTREKEKMISNHEMTSENAEKWFKHEIDNFDERIRKRSERDKLAFNSLKSMRSNTFVNSWHMQEHESASMWRLYAEHSEGIAIESTYSRLISSLSVCEIDINIGIVKYLDYTKDFIPNNGQELLPFLHKRKSFEQEKELRALCIEMSPNSNGIYIPVKLDELIKRIYLAPTAPGWVLKSLQSLIKKYQIHKLIIQSDLTSSPIY